MAREEISDGCGGMSDTETAPEIPESIKPLADACIKEHVDVVQAIISGDYSSNTKAYLSVYPDCEPDSARANVARMLAIDSVADLYEALRDLRLERGIISRAQAMKILSDMAETPLSDLVEFGTYEVETEDGPKTQSVWSFKDAENMTEKQKRTILELSTTREGLKIKQHDPKAAIKQLSEMRGWDAPKKVEHSGVLAVTTKEMTLEEAEQVYAENLRQLRE